MIFMHPSFNIRWFIGLALTLGLGAATLQAGDAYKILLVGDSTTIGNLPRQLNPEGLHLEHMIEQLGHAEGLRPLGVINTGKGGETAQRLLGSKWYDQHIAPVSDMDLIFVRMGINDWFKCDDFEADFPGQLKALLGQLRIDPPNALIVPATICRFMPTPDCEAVNKLIKQVAADEGLDLFDLYTPYNQYLRETGANSLNVRQPSLSHIPEKYHAWLKPRTYFQKGWNDRPDQFVVRVNDTSLDPIFGHLPGWYGDRHPNSEGYNLIAVETVKFLIPLLKIQPTG